MLISNPYTSAAGITAPSKRRRLEILRQQLKQEFKQHEPHLRDLADFVRPRRPRWEMSDRNRGDRRNQRIIDGSATFSSRVLQAGMHSGMTSPARPWMKVKTGNTDLNKYPSVARYLHEVTQRMLSIFAFTNLYNALPVHYGDMGVFATAATAILEDDKDLFRAYSYPIGSYAIATDHRGLVNNWVHECNKTVLEVVEEYLWDKESNTIDWSRASRTLRNMWDRQNYTTPVPVAWVITPNFMMDKSSIKASKRMPFYSCHFECAQDQEDLFLRETGYNEFPIMVSRWDVTGNDWWGTDCPGMVALGDIKQLQTGERRAMQAIEKMVYPPLKAPTSMRSQKTSLLPADITYYDMTQGNEGPTPLHETTLRLDHLEQKQAQVRQRISRAFYEDLFLMLAYADPTRGVQPPTAAEVAERHEEKLIALGPVLERTNDELLDPIVDRVYAMMDRAGLLPEAPRELEDVDLMVEYTSIMAQAMQLVGVVANERFVQTVGGLSQINPLARHKLDVMKAVDVFGSMLGVDPALIVDTDKAQAVADQEAQAAAAAQQAETMKSASAGVQSLAAADTSGDNALRQIVEGVV